jgi:thiol peroxidase
MNSNNVKFAFGPMNVTLAGNEIKAGDKAPDFVVMGNDLQPVKLSDYAGKKRIISVFPSVDTPVCAAQNRNFNKMVSELDNTVILSISNDLPFAQKRFCGAEGIDKVVTLSDYKDLDFGAKYGFVIDELRLLARGVVVVDENDQVKYVEYVPEAGMEPNYDKALEAVKSI